jgi:hypothetical protein
MPSSASLEQVLLFLHRFNVTARELRSRDPARSSFVLRDDVDVRDLAFAMLKTLLPDLERHTSTGGPADLGSESLGLVIDVKSTLWPGRERTLLRECHERIERSVTFSGLNHLVFFVYDPDAMIADRARFAQELAGARTHAGTGFVVHVVGPGFPVVEQRPQGVAPKFTAEAPSDQEAMARLLEHVAARSAHQTSVRIDFAETDLLLRLRLGSTKRLIKATMGNRFLVAQEGDDAIVFREPAPSLSARESF